MASASSSPPDFQVFISHAGEDKKTIAFPLSEMLREQGIKAFVDHRDIQLGKDATEEMTSAMDKADIAVLVLSPEFVAKKWPMKELLFFLKRREDALANGMAGPVILPVFYRLSVKDLYAEPKFDRKCADGLYLYYKTGFFERAGKKEPEANKVIVKDALQKLHGFQGVENKGYHASNETESRPARLLLLRAIVARVSELVEGEMSLRVVQRLRVVHNYVHMNKLQDVVLNFVSVDDDGNPVRDEGGVRQRTLTIDARHGVCREHCS